MEPITGRQSLKNILLTITDEEAKAINYVLKYVQIEHPKLEELKNKFKNIIKNIEIWEQEQRP